MNRYKSLEDVRDDLELCFKNVQLVNSPGTKPSKVSSYHHQWLIRLLACNFHCEASCCSNCLSSFFVSCNPLLCDGHWSLFCRDKHPQKCGPITSSPEGEEQCSLPLRAWYLLVFIGRVSYACLMPLSHKYNAHALPVP